MVIVSGVKCSGFKYPESIVLESFVRSHLSGVNCSGVKCPESIVLESIVLESNVRSQMSWSQMSDSRSVVRSYTKQSSFFVVSFVTELYCILSPVGQYWSTGMKPVNLMADPKFVRAWPGGSGYCKMGSNYAPTIYIGVQLKCLFKKQQ